MGVYANQDRPDTEPMTFGRVSVLEFYAAMMGALQAIQAVATGRVDPDQWLQELDEWDRFITGDGEHGTSDWPGWVEVGVAEAPSPERQTTRQRPSNKRRLVEIVEGPIPRSGAWVVYRHYDAAGYLLYVGKSQSFVSRHSQHRTGALWWEEIVRITVQSVSDSAEARAVELVAIATEDPEWNVADRP